MMNASLDRHLMPIRLGRTSGSPAERHGRQRLYGICLTTDADNYMSLAERLDPRELAVHLNLYYEALFHPIRRHGGIISDVAGDGVVAYWEVPTNAASTFERACDAAREIQFAIAGFNKRHPDRMMPTRVGLHTGELALLRLGTMTYPVHRCVGDMVNTACRIQSLNKLLGTRVLLSASCLSRTSRDTARAVGNFLLCGKQTTIDIHELPSDTPLPVSLRLEFARALQLLQRGRILAALQHFRDLANRFPTDGPTAFYVAQCEAALTGGKNLTSNGTVRLQSK